MAHDWGIRAIPFAAQVWLELGDGSVVVLGAPQAAADARQLVAEYEAPGRVSKDLADLVAGSGAAAAAGAKLAQPPRLALRVGT